MSDITITNTPNVIIMESALETLTISNDSISVNISDDYPKNPIFDNVAVNEDMSIDGDCDVFGNLYTDYLTVENQINTDNLMVSVDSYLTNVDVSGTAKLARASIGGNTNYSQFEDSGFLAHKSGAMPFEDLNFDVINSGGPASGVPDAVLINNLYYREFTSANNQHCSGSKEIYHAAYITTGQSLVAHTHIFLKAGESAGTTGITYTIYWELRQGASTTNGSVTASATSAQLAANPHKIDLYAAMGFTGPTELGGQLTMRLARTGGNAGDVIAITYGCHVALDAGGSRTALSK